MKEEWLMPGAIVPVDVETTATLVAEIKRLIWVVGGMALSMQPAQEPVAWRWLYGGKPEDDTCFPMPGPDADWVERGALCRIPVTPQYLYTAPQPRKIGNTVHLSREQMAELFPQPEQPVQEPVAWHHPDCQGECIACLIERAVQDAYGTQGRNYLLRHVTPQPRQWRGLTDEEIGMLTVFDGLHHVEVPVLADFARAIEQALREKNGGGV